MISGYERLNGRGEWLREGELLKWSGVKPPWLILDEESGKLYEFTRVEATKGGYIVWVKEVKHGEN